MSRSLKITASTVVLRPARTTTFLWIFLGVTAFSAMLWKFSLYDTSPRALWLLLFPAVMLAGAIIENLHPRLSVTTIDRTRNLVLLKRRALLGSAWTSRRFSLSDFVAITSYSIDCGRTLMCRVVLVTPDLQSLTLTSEPSGFAGRSFLSGLKPAEPREVQELRQIIARVTGLKDLGFRESVPPYRPVAPSPSDVAA